MLNFGRKVGLHNKIEVEFMRNPDKEKAPVKSPKPLAVLG